MTARMGSGPRVRDELRLTRRQLEVIDLIARGYTNGRIAESLGISLDGAKWHVSELIRVFNVETREQAVIAWRAYNQPGKRLRRSLPALSPTLAWAAGATLSVVLVAAAFAIWAFNRGEGDPPASPDPSATTETHPGSPPPADATPTTGATVTASDPEVLATANLLVYADEADYRDTDSRRWPILEVVSYDLDADREVASFRVGDVNDYVYGVELVGRDVLIAFEHHILLSDLSGQTQRDVYRVPPTQVITTTALSHDGRLLAIGLEPDNFVGTASPELVILDMASGAIVRTFNLETLTMPPAPAAWHADGSAVEFFGYFHHDGGTQWATAFMDGRVEPRVPGTIDPAGRLRLEHGVAGGLGCEGSDRHVVVDLASGAPLSELATPGYVLMGGTWSPDSSEVLVAVFELAARPPEGCWDWSGVSYFLWSLHGDTAEPVADFGGVIHRWAKDRRIGVQCLGEVQPPTAVIPWVNCGVDSGSPEATLLLNGSPVATVRNARIVGFADAP